jgi:16S rRNA (cytosine1402-N4)-methyltransferase
LFGGDAKALRFMSDDPSIPSEDARPAGPHRRRSRYSGKNPRRFEDKYKERLPELHAATVAKVLASGRTPAGMHRPIMVAEILLTLDPKPGEVAIDATLGYGGHTRELLARLQPGGRLIGLDADPIELPKTEARLRADGFGPETLTATHSNFAGLPKVLVREGLTGADCILADLGVSSMQLDDPGRGFSTKGEGPLDMRMNPGRGYPASALLARLAPGALTQLLRDNADEPHAAELGEQLAGRQFETTRELAGAIRAAMPGVEREQADLTVRRAFQALRIAVNEEFSALETFLRNLPACMNPGGRAAVLTFHSGEDRRVKKSFRAGLRSGLYTEISEEVIRPGSEERRENPRSSSAKLRWARKAPRE